ncbi:uncharacterized protein C8Q71DRAFT_327137 [Rhodofomes roseus]|uniref:Uncharacterized protein n=1 Tax=Rhodofomes roseus TaxID=34475 RepID=A0ABQ8KS52_9APHY|nr:uncharacterized protein C8Q71DRAFT_327137 [Rhodofomes roseus]KAH9841384.1 hypothetical protein C8Q71DRAFT_327137 [Rhodofomes roseus]
MLSGGWPSPSASGDPSPHVRLPVRGCSPKFGSLFHVHLHSDGGRRGWDSEGSSRSGLRKLAQMSDARASWDPRLVGLSMSFSPYEDSTATWSVALRDGQMSLCGRQVSISPAQHAQSVHKPGSRKKTCARTFGPGSRQTTRTRDAASCCYMLPQSILHCVGTERGVGMYSMDVGVSTYPMPCNEEGSRYLRTSCTENVHADRLSLAYI